MVQNGPMRSALRRLAIRHVLPWSWWLSPERTARSLQRFALVESDSAWQFLRAVEVVRDRRLRAALFHDAVEEMGHADAFAALARAHAARPLPPPRAERRALLTRDEELPEFLAYIHAGEREVSRELLLYARAAGDREEFRALLEAIRGEEAGHAEDMRAALDAAGGGSVARIARRIRLRRLRESLGRLAVRLGDMAGTLLYGLVYVLTAPIVAGAARRRLARRSPLPGSRHRAAGMRDGGAA